MNKHSFSKYDYKNRWISYWHQIDEVLSLGPEKILEIGIGNKTVSDYLKKQGVELITFDIDKKLKPDVVGNLLHIPFPSDSFDVVLCAEVLEHLPFEKFNRALQELKRVARKYVVLSLPHFGYSLKFSFKIPLLKEKKIAVKIPLSKRHIFDGEHYWEIGKSSYSLPKIKRIIENHFAVKKEFIPFENQYHHFFVLEKL